MVIWNEGPLPCTLFVHSIRAVLHVLQILHRDNLNITSLGIVLAAAYFGKASFGRETRSLSDYMCR